MIRTCDFGIRSPIRQAATRGGKRKKPAKRRVLGCDELRLPAAFGAGPYAHPYAHEQRSGVDVLLLGDPCLGEDLLQEGDVYVAFVLVRDALLVAPSLHERVPASG